MAYDKVVDSSVLDAAIKASADAIREKTGETALIPWLQDKGFAEAIAAIESGGGVQGLLASGTIVPTEDVSNYQLDTGINLVKKKFILWYADINSPPTSSYMAVIGHDVVSNNYKHFGINGAGNVYSHSASLRIIYSTIVKLSGVVGNYSYTLRAGCKYCWAVYDSTFDGLG